MKNRFRTFFVLSAAVIMMIGMMSVSVFAEPQGQEPAGGTDTVINVPIGSSRTVDVCGSSGTREITEGPVIDNAGDKAAPYVHLEKSTDSRSFRVSIDSERSIIGDTVYVSMKIGDMQVDTDAGNAAPVPAPQPAAGVTERYRINIIDMKTVEMDIVKRTAEEIDVPYEDFTNPAVSIDSIINRVDFNVEGNLTVLSNLAHNKGFRCEADKDADTGRTEARTVEYLTADAAGSEQLLAVYTYKFTVTDKEKAPAVIQGTDRPEDTAQTADRSEVYHAPETSDESNILPLIGLLVLSGAGIAAIIIYAVKKKD